MIGQEVSAYPVPRCAACGQENPGLRHYYRDGGCRRVGRVEGRGGVRGGLFSLVPIDSEVQTNQEVNRTMEEHKEERARANAQDRREIDLQIERCLSRYGAGGSPDMAKLDADDWRTIRMVLDYLRSNRRTGAWLPPRRQLDILTELEKFPPLQIGYACHGFMAARGIETRKPLRYFLGIVRGSAATKHAELVSHRHVNGSYHLEA